MQRRVPKSSDHESQAIKPTNPVASSAETFGKRNQQAIDAPEFVLKEDARSKWLSEETSESSHIPPRGC
jgi:hypothetical protein